MKKPFILTPLLGLILLTGCAGNPETPASSAPSAATTTPPPAASPSASYSLSDVALHKTAEDCWTVIGGEVYDLTAFIALGIHNPKIVDGCGIDATEIFKAIEKHGEANAQSNLAKNKIGTLTQ